MLGSRYNDVANHEIIDEGIIHKGGYRSAADDTLVHPGNKIVDEVLPVAMVATLNVMQPLLVHATL